MAIHFVATTAARASGIVPVVVGPIVVLVLAYLVASIVWIVVLSIRRASTGQVRSDQRTNTTHTRINTPHYIPRPKAPFECSRRCRDKHPSTARPNCMRRPSCRTVQNKETHTRCCCLVLS